VARVVNKPFEPPAIEAAIRALHGAPLPAAAPMSAP
jgi:hypothetical protein